MIYSKLAFEGEYLNGKEINCAIYTQNLKMNI